MGAAGALCGSPIREALWQIFRPAVPAFFTLIPLILPSLPPLPIGRIV